MTLDCDKCHAVTLQWSGEKIFLVYRLLLVTTESGELEPVSYIPVPSHSPFPIVRWNKHLYSVPPQHGWCSPRPSWGEHRRPRRRGPSKTDSPSSFLGPRRPTGEKSKRVHWTSRKENQILPELFRRVVWVSFGPHLGDGEGLRGNPCSQAF